MQAKDVINQCSCSLTEEDESISDEESEGSAVCPSSNIQERCTCLRKCEFVESSKSDTTTSQEDTSCCNSVVSSESGSAISKEDKCLCDSVVSSESGSAISTEDKCLCDSDVSMKSDSSLSQKDKGLCDSVVTSESDSENSQEGKCLCDSDVSCASDSANSQEGNGLCDSVVTSESDKENSEEGKCPCDSDATSESDSANSQEGKCLCDSVISSESDSTISQEDKGSCDSDVSCESDSVIFQEDEGAISKKDEGFCDSVSSSESESSISEDDEGFGDLVVSSQWGSELSKNDKGFCDSDLSSESDSAISTEDKGFCDSDVSKKSDSAISTEDKCLCDSVISSDSDSSISQEDKGSCDSDLSSESDSAISEEDKGSCDSDVSKKSDSAISTEDKCLCDSVVSSESDSSISQEDKDSCDSVVSKKSNSALSQKDKCLCDSVISSESDSSISQEDKGSCDSVMSSESDSSISQEDKGSCDSDVSKKSDSALSQKDKGLCDSDVSMKSDSSLSQKDKGLCDSVISSESDSTTSQEDKGSCDSEVSSESDSAISEEDKCICDSVVTSESDSENSQEGKCLCDSEVSSEADSAIAQKDKDFGVSAVSSISGSTISPEDKCSCDPVALKDSKIVISEEDKCYCYPESEGPAANTSSLLTEGCACLRKLELELKTSVAKTVTFPEEGCSCYPKKREFFKKQAKINKKKRKTALLEKAAMILAKVDLKLKKENKVMIYDEETKDILPRHMRKAKFARKAAELKAKDNSNLYQTLPKINARMCKKLYGKIKEKLKKPRFQSVRIAVRIGFMNGRLKYMVYKIPQGKNGEKIRAKAENNPDVFMYHITHDKVVPYVPLPKRKRKPGTNKRLLQNKYSNQKFSRPITKNLRFQKETGPENNRPKLTKLKSEKKMPGSKTSKLVSRATNTTSVKIGGKNQAKLPASKQLIDGIKNQSSIERKPKGTEPPTGKAGGKRQQAPTGRGITRSSKATNTDSTSAMVGSKKQAKSQVSKQQDVGSKKQPSGERKPLGPEPPAGTARGKKPQLTTTKSTNTISTSAKVGDEKQAKLPASKQQDDASKKQWSNERNSKGPDTPAGKARGKKPPSPTGKGIPGSSKAASTNIASTSAKVVGEKQGKSPISKKQDDASKIQSSGEKKSKGQEPTAGTARGKKPQSPTAASTNTISTSAKVGGEKQTKSIASKKQDDAGEIQTTSEKKPKGQEPPAGKAGGKSPQSPTGRGVSGSFKATNTDSASAMVGSKKQAKSQASKKQDDASKIQSSSDRKPLVPETPASKAGGKKPQSPIGRSISDPFKTTSTNIASTSAKVGGEKQGKSPISKKQDDASKIQSSSEKKSKGQEPTAGTARGKKPESLTGKGIPGSIKTASTNTISTSAKVVGEKQGKSPASKKQEDASKIQSSIERKPKGPEPPAGKAGGKRRQSLTAASTNTIATSAKVGGEKQGKSLASKKQDSASQTQSPRVRKPKGPETPAGKAGGKRPQLGISKGTNTNIVSTSAKVGDKLQAISTKKKTGQVLLAGKKPALKQQDDASKKVSSKKGKLKSPKPQAGKAGRKKPKLRTIRGIPGSFKDSVVRLDKLLNLIPTKKQIIRRPQLRKISFAKILSLAEKKEAKMNAPSKGQIVKIPVVPVRELVQMIFKPVFDLKGNYCYPLAQLSKMLRFEIERPKNAKSKVDLSIILNKIESKQLMLRKLQARKRHRALIRRALKVKRGKRLGRDLEQTYGKGKVPHNILARTVYAEMGSKSIPKSLKGKQIYKKLLKKNIRKFKVKGRGVPKKKYFKKLLDKGKGQADKEILDNDRRAYVQRITKEIAKNASKVRREVKPDLKKPAPSSKKLGEQKMPKKLAMIPSIKPPAPICKEDTVPKVGPVVKVVLNRFTRKNKLIVETIIFEDIIGLFSASLKHSRLNLAESRKILTLMERYNCVNRQYNNTLFMINNCTFYNTATRNFASLPYIDSLRNSKMLKNYLDQFGKVSPATSSLSLVPSCSSLSFVSKESGTPKESSSSMTSSSRTMVITSNIESSSDKQVVKKALDGTIDSFVTEPTMVEDVVQDVSKPAKVSKIETPEIETEAADFKQRRLFKDSLIMKKIFHIRQTQKKSKTFLPEDASSSSSYKKARVVARQKLDEPEKNVTCLYTDSAKAVCEECGYTICKNCFGRIVWVLKKMPKSESQRKESKQVYIQECLCSCNLVDYRYKVMLLKYHRRVCYNCFLDTLDHDINANNGKVRFLEEYKNLTNNQEVDVKSSLTEDRRITPSSTYALSTSSSPLDSNYSTSFMFDTSVERENSTFSVLKSDSHRKFSEEDGRRSSTDTGLKSILKRSGRESIATENGKQSSDRSHRSSKRSERRVSFLDNDGISSEEKTLSIASNNVKDDVIPNSGKTAVIKYQKQSKAKKKSSITFNVISRYK
ncbi:uncharacterized protein isoform X3 [Rhodnius prolixus]|uniref:uncharacterized protein isoform X3 n=1 Tax=Rhodnius prolixus TaxID=13249 RepID=UPI003D18898B